MLITNDLSKCCYPHMLLPADKEVNLSGSKEALKFFNTISGLYGFAIRALENLKVGKLTEFDSLATDCSCHLRALQIALIAKELKSLSKVFGGPVMTLTDAAVAAGYLQVQGATSEDIGLSHGEAKGIVKDVCEHIYRAIVRLRGKRQELPVILVGEGASILSPLFQDFNLKGWIPLEAGVANAYGAALAEISIVIDGVFSLKEREKVLEQLKKRAIKEAVNKGANVDLVRIVGVSILPFTYTSDALAKVTITASGPKILSI